jgi:hypothetical protein
MARIARVVGPGIPPTLLSASTVDSRPFGEDRSAIGLGKTLDRTFRYKQSGPKGEGKK